MIKKILLLIIVISIYSCGEEYSQSEFNQKYTKNHCHKTFTCSEAQLKRIIYAGSESTCNDQYESTIADCSVDEVYDGDYAVDCVECVTELSCSEYFDSKTRDDNCKPVCDKVCQRK